MKSKSMTKRQERKAHMIKYLMFKDTNEIIELNDDGFIKNENQNKKMIIPKIQLQPTQRRHSQLSVSQTLTIDNSSTNEPNDQGFLNSDDLCLPYSNYDFSPMNDIDIFSDNFLEL